MHIAASGESFFFRYICICMLSPNGESGFSIHMKNSQNSVKVMPIWCYVNSHFTLFSIENKTVYPLRDYDSQFKRQANIVNVGASESS